MKAIEDMSPPQTLKEMRKLAGQVTVFGRFISKLGERTLPFFKLMKKKGPFEWTPEADQAFQDLNGLRQELRFVLSFPPVVSAAHLVPEMAKTTPAAASGSPAAKRRCSRPGFDHGWALVDSPESMTGGAQPC